MSLDVVDLRNFYSQPLGILARRTLGRSIASLWPEAKGLRVLGVGYPTPYLGLFRADSERCVAFMPAQQGVLKWPTARPTLSALVEDHEWPCVDGMFDRVLLVHSLEMVQDPGAMLREAWRVLAAGGRLIVVVPNRGGVWARADATPFGHGRPYSRSQIAFLLREASFTPVTWAESLYMPPVARSWALRWAGAWERTGARVNAPFAGVHLVDATKQVYRMVPQRRERRRLVPGLEPVLQPQAGRLSDVRAECCD